MSCESASPDGVIRFAGVVAMEDSVEDTKPLLPVGG